MGATQDDIDTRIDKHNQKTYGNHRYTAIAADWELFLFIPTKDYAQAIRIERKVKSMKSSIYIRNLAQYPEMIQKLLSST